MTSRRRWMWALGTLVIGLFVSGVVWRALNPNADQNPTEERDIKSRQDGYYLCLDRSQMTPAEMYRLIKRKLPDDDTTLALRGCQEAQPGS